MRGLLTRLLGAGEPLPLRIEDKLACSFFHRLFFSRLNLHLASTYMTMCQKLSEETAGAANPDTLNVCRLDNPLEAMEEFNKSRKVGEARQPSE